MPNIRTKYSPTPSATAVHVTGTRNTLTRAPRCSRTNGTARRRPRNPTFGWGRWIEGSRAGREGRDKAVEMERLRSGWRVADAIVSGIGPRRLLFPHQIPIPTKKRNPVRTTPQGYNESNSREDDMIHFEGEKSFALPVAEVAAKLSDAGFLVGCLADTKVVEATPDR